MPLILTNCLKISVKTAQAYVPKFTFVFKQALPDSCFVQSALA